MKSKSKHEWRLLWALVLLTIVFFSSSAQSLAEEAPVTLTLQYIFENHLPEDLSLVQEAVDALVYASEGFHVRLVPFLRVNGTDVQRQAQYRVLQKEGVVFDLLHSSMPGEQMRPLDDLLQSDGQEILELFTGELGQLLKKGTIYSLPSLADYATAQGVAMREDLVQAYAPEAVFARSLKDLDPIYEKVSKACPDLYMVSSYVTGRGLLYRATGISFSGTIFCVNEEGEVISPYRTQAYADSLKLFSRWYDAGYLYEYGPLQDISATELVRAGLLFSYVCAYKPGIEREVSEGCGMPMVVVQTSPSVVTGASLSRSWGISVASPHPREAMHLLSLLYTNASLADLLANGIEGIDYRVTEDLRIEALNEDETFWCDGNWILPNETLCHVRSTSAPELWEELTAFNREAYLAPNLGFTFDPTPVLAQNEKLESIVSQYGYGLEIGFLDPDIYLEQMLEQMEAAGEETVREELANQYEAWKREEDS